MKQLMVCILLTVFLIGMTSAEDVTGEFNREFDLKRPCFNNGSFCSSTSVCNITITYPDSTLLADNIIMTNQGSYHNITISQPENKQLGIHPAFMSCQDGTLFGSDTFDMIITADGKEFQQFPTQIVILIIGVFLTGMGLFQERLRLFKHLGAMIVMITGVITVYPGYSFINHSNLLGQSIGFSSIGMGFYFLVEDFFSRDVQEEGFQSRNREF